MIRINNDYQLLVYDGMAIDMMLNIVIIDDNPITDANTIIITNAHYNGDDDHYSNWYW